MHKTIILSRYIGNPGKLQPFDFCYTFDGTMFICREACYCLARKLSPTHQYVVTFSDEYSPGYRRVQLDASDEAKIKRNTFELARKQEKWITALGLKTLDNLVGHFYVKITPFE